MKYDTDQTTDLGPYFLKNHKQTSGADDKCRDWRAKG